MQETNLSILTTNICKRIHLIAQILKPTINHPSHSNWKYLYFKIVME